MDQISELKGIIQRVTKKTKTKQWPCFYPNCNHKSIMSHSQTKNTSLKKIADQNNHVMQRNLNPLPLRMPMGWSSVSIGKSSRFPGFCNNHDQDLFKKADLIGGNNITQKALALLSFRTFALEMRKKEVMSDQISRLLFYRDKFIDPSAVEHIEARMEGMQNCLSVTKPYYLRRYHQMIVSKDYSPMTHRVFIPKSNLGVSCSTCINPLDIGQFPYNKAQPLISFNILPRQKYTIITFSCFKDCKKLMDDFINHYQRIEDIVFNFCEEVAVSISVFKSLSDETVGIIDEAQKPWEYWQPISVPDIFDLKLTKDSTLVI